MSTKRTGWKGTPYLIGVILLLGVGGPVASMVRTHFRMKSFTAVPFGSAEAKKVEIPPVSSAATVSKLLFEAKVVSADDLFEKTLGAKKLSEANLKAGEYEFKGPLLPDQVAERIAKGEVKRHPFTVKAGERLDQLLPRLAALGIGLDPEQLDRAAHSRPMLTKLGLKGADSLEGFIFPGDYALTKGPAEEETLVSLAEPALKQLKAHPPADGDPLSPMEVVTLASLVEQELNPTPAAELAHLSCVFRNRLKAGRLLESEASARYAELLEKGTFPTGTPDHKSEKPYNTFQRKGLPPGPVAAPSPEAVQAALHPADCNDLFYLVQPDHSLVYCPDARCVAKARPAPAEEEHARVPPPHKVVPKGKKRRH